MDDNQQLPNPIEEKAMDLIALIVAIYPPGMRPLLASKRIAEALAILNGKPLSEIEAEENKDG